MLESEYRANQHLRAVAIQCRSRLKLANCVGKSAWVAQGHLTARRPKGGTSELDTRQAVVSKKAPGRELSRSYHKHQPA